MLCTFYHTQLYYGSQVSKVTLYENYCTQLLYGRQVPTLRFAYHTVHIHFMVVKLVKISQHPLAALIASAFNSLITLIYLNGHWITEQEPGYQFC